MVKKTALAVLLAALSAPLLSAAAGAAPLPKGIGKLSHGELRRLFPGQFKVVVRGYTVRMKAHGNGRLEGHYKGLSDTGRWSLRGSRLCIMMKDWLDGKTTCASVHRASGKWLKTSSIRFRKM